MEVGSASGWLVGFGVLRKSSICVGSQNDYYPLSRKQNLHIPKCATKKKKSMRLGQAGKEGGGTRISQETKKG